MASRTFDSPRAQEAQIDAEYGDDIIHELLRKSKMSCHGAQGLWDSKDRTRLAEEILVSYIDQPSGLETYFLAIALLDRILQRLSSSTFEDRESFWALFAAVIRLAGKYDGRLGSALADWADEEYISCMKDEEPNRQLNRMDARQNVNRIEEKLLRALGHDLQWPTPLPFLHRLAKVNNGGDILVNATEAILVVASIHNVFQKLPAHIIAAASHSLCSKLLRLVQPELTYTKSQRLPKREVLIATKDLETAVRAGLTKSHPWKDLSSEWKRKIRWAAVLLTQFSCRLRIGRRKEIERAELLYSLRESNDETVARELRKLCRLLLCRRHHDGEFEKLHAQLTAALEKIPIRLTDDCRDHGLITPQLTPD